MRVVYVLVTLVFVFLCIFFTRWYLCTVRGLCESVANGEILAMIFIALFIGFTGSWMMNENTFRFLKTQLGMLQRERTLMRDQLMLLEKENQSTRSHILHWQQEVTMLAQVKKVTEPLLMEAKNHVASLERDLKEFQLRYEILRQETDSIRRTAEQLKDQLVHTKSISVTLSSPENSGTSPKPLFSKPSPAQPREDLTLINGIGPAIQKKLYGLGITTFKQISELTPEMVDEVAKAIKFFPDRIGRDNWIGQAAAFAKKK